MASDTDNLDPTTGEWTAGAPHVGETVWLFDQEGAGPIAATVIDNGREPFNRSKWMPDPPGDGKIHVAAVVPSQGGSRLFPVVDVAYHLPRKGEPVRRPSWRRVGEVYR